MRLLLIAPNSFEFSCHSEQVDTSSKPFNNILTELIGKKADILIIPAEQTIVSCFSPNFSGIELIKHIRLTPELENINKLPIILLHWHSIDYYINKTEENIFLYSPGIYRYRLPYDKIDFNLEKLPELESLIPYLFGSKNDKLINDHVFRNTIALDQFNKQLNNPSVDSIGEPLWFKKFFYKNFGSSDFQKSTVSKLNNLSLNIMLIDDLADEWKVSIHQLLPKSSIQVEKDPLNLLKSFSDNFVVDIDELNRINRFDDSAIDKFSLKVLKAKFDIILLDIYFGNEEINIEQSSGYNFLMELEDMKIDIPVMIFSATLKDLSLITSRFEFVFGRFIKGYTPLINFSSKLEEAAIISQLFNISTNIRKLENILQIPTMNFCKKIINSSGTKTISNLNRQEVFGITLNLKSLRSKLHLLTNRYSKSQQKSEVNKNLLEVIGLLGIIQEYRVDKDCPNYLLSDSEKNLISLRNVAFHSNTLLTRSSEVALNHWNISSLKDRILTIENAFKTTFEGLLFGR